ncbi:MAG TPA: hypothetical protein VJ986_01260 [Gaiellaceae bacterium]|nr:hypothetical protein [Gaiellaceae bacterium]
MARILLAEADPDVRRLLVLLLERLGHEVVVLEGPPGVAPRADLMVLEPASGSCLGHARRARDLQPSLPVICVSILPEDASFLAFGPVDYLAKPFAIDDLRDAVERALDHSPQAA